MEDEAFDSFNAPQFVDFSKTHDPVDESIDAFFDVDHESISKSLIKQRKISDEAYFSPQNIDSLMDNIRPESSEPSFENPRELYRARKSVSVGNLIMFSEEEYREDYYKTNLVEICESVKSLTVSHEFEKPEKKPKEKRKNDSKASNSCRSSNQSLSKKDSQDHLNKLAQPKRYASVENLKQNGNSSKFVSLAEAVNQFQNRTPIRFRSKPNLQAQTFQPLQKTVPESPALQTKLRSRPGQHIMSHEEREQIEFENMQKFKIKAHPVNKKILQGPLKPTVPVEKKLATVPQPFKLTAAPPKKTAPSPQKYEFRAKPMPRSAEKPKRLQEIERRSGTKPVTPTFMKNYKAPSHKTTAPEPNQQQKPEDEYPRKLTKPKPFSFEHRDMMVHRKREQLIQKIRDEERRAREFHAKPVPKSIYKKSDSMKSDSGSSFASSKRHDTLSNENLHVHFKARPPKVLYQEPFVPAKSDKPLTQVVPFQLESDLRYQEREEYERERKLKEEKLEYLKRVEEEERLRQEQEEIARLRRELEYKAKPIKKYKQIKILPSGKVTQPISPNFHSARQKNKENIPDNSFSSC